MQHTFYSILACKSNKNHRGDVSERRTTHAAINAHTLSSAFSLMAHVFTNTTSADFMSSVRAYPAFSSTLCTISVSDVFI